MGTPIARCVVEPVTVSIDRSGNATVTLRRQPPEDPATAPEMAPNGLQDMIVRLYGVEIAPGGDYHLDLVPVDAAEPGGAGYGPGVDWQVRAEQERQFPILRYFRYDHLREPLKNVSSQFADLAYEMAGQGHQQPGGNGRWAAQAAGSQGRLRAQRSVESIGTPKHNCGAAAEDPYVEFHHRLHHRRQEQDPGEGRSRSPSSRAT